MFNYSIEEVKLLQSNPHLQKKKSTGLDTDSNF